MSARTDWDATVEQTVMPAGRSGWWPFESRASVPNAAGGRRDTYALYSGGSATVSTRSIASDMPAR